MRPSPARRPSPCRPAHLLWLALALAGWLPPAEASPSRVVELFESRDCPACPAARTNLDALARRADVLALSYPVSFRAPAEWPAAGVRPEFLRRQADYVVATGAGEVATPQLVLNGRLLVPGNDAAELAVLLQYATPLEARPQLRQVGDVVLLGGQPPRHETMDVWLVEYSPQVAGKDAVHRNVVRRLVRLAAWSGGPLRLAVPRAPVGRALALLVQHQDRGAIAAALELATVSVR